MTQHKLIDLLQASEDDWPPDAAATILEGLTGSELETRTIAVQLASGAITEPIAEQLLELIAAEPDEDLRIDAALALGESLQDYMFEEPSQLGGLSEEGTERIQQRLEELYRDLGLPDSVRQAILEGAVRLPRPWHDEAVHEIWASDDLAWKSCALNCMGFLAGFESTILGALNHDSLDIRGAACDAAATAMLTEAGPLLSALARDPRADIALRIKAIIALPLLIPPDGEQVLSELLSDTEADIVEAAEIALQELEIARALDLESDVF